MRPLLKVISPYLSADRQESPTRLRVAATAEQGGGLIASCLFSESFLLRGRGLKQIEQKI